MKPSLIRRAILRAVPWTSRYALTYVCAALFAMTGCSRDPSSAPKMRGVIHSQRQVYHPELDSDAKALRRTATGEFVIAMATSTATAAMTDDQGILKWKYKDPVRGELGYVEESAFNGVVPLPNGNVLFCGNKLSGYRKGKALLMIFDVAGAKIEERMMTPNNEDRYPGADFLRCMPWNDGIVLAGTALKPTVGAFGWIVKLDKFGKIEWEVLDDSLAPSQVVAMQDGSLVIAADNGFQMHIARMTSKGEISSTRILNGSAGVLLHPINPTNTLTLLLYRGTEKTLIYRLDEHLQDAVVPRPINSTIDITHGCGYVLADGSLALFGRAAGAVRMLVAANGDKMAGASFGEPQSFSIIDAVAISENEFVSLRRTDGPYPKAIGLMLAWDTFR